jgi:hypothetical protein
LPGLRAVLLMGVFLALLREPRAAVGWAVGPGWLVVVQAVEAEPTQFGGASPDTGQQLDRGSPSRAGLRLEGVEVVLGEQLGEYLMGQGPAGVIFAALLAP